MKKIALIINMLFAIGICAQGNDFTLGLIMPEPSHKINEAQISKLETKLSNLINKSGVVSYGYSNDFVILPIINIDDSSVVQGGMENLTVSTLDLTLNIKQISSNKSFNIISKKIKGSGKTQDLALTNAFSLIKVNDKDFIDFIAKAKEKIFKYFNENCTNIQTKAKSLAAKQDLEQAISLLQSIPETGNNCFETAQKDLAVYYKAYQSRLCKENIAKAKLEIAVKNYQSAFSYLNMIDGGSTCFAEVEKLTAQISDKVEKTENKELDLEKRRLEAIKEIAKAYYSNAKKTVQYNIIVK